jgi:hypothetical protein
MRTCEYLKGWQPELGRQEILQSVESLGDLNLPYTDWNGNVVCSSGSQAFINSFVWENGLTQVVDSPSQGDGLLDIYLVLPES